MILFSHLTPRIHLWTFEMISSTHPLFTLIMLICIFWIFIIPSIKTPDLKSIQTSGWKLEEILVWGTEDHPSTHDLPSSSCVNLTTHLNEKTQLDQHLSSLHLLRRLRTVFLMLHRIITHLILKTIQYHLLLTRKSWDLLNVRISVTDVMSR